MRRHEEGSALVTVMVMITVMTLLIGTVMAIYVVQHRFTQRDLHRLQARYTAEAGVHSALAALQEDTYWRTQGTIVALPNEQTSWVTVESFGLFVRITAAAQVGEARTTIQALVGHAPPAAFDHALILDDPASGLNIAGRARITGDIMTGEMGVQESILDGRPFVGSMLGQVHSFSAFEVPTFDAAQAEAFVETARNYLQGDMHLPASDSLHVVHVTGDVHLGPAESAVFDKPVLMVASGSLTLEGDIDFLPGSVFVAGEDVRLAGDVTGRGGIFYGRSSITVTGQVACAGQFFSSGSIRIQDQAYLRYPSLLYLTPGATSTDSPRMIEVAGEAAVDGMVLYPYYGGTPEQGQVIVGPTATVRGSLFNQYSTELRGTVAGTLITRQLHFYESPTHYVNWLYDATIDRSQRPLEYGLPGGFAGASQPVIIALEEMGESIRGER